ncbi:unnamed protein product [Rotaria sp. Silwood2]|nr:unnamed protein product [Rotaria sp. Silwood2]
MDGVKRKLSFDDLSEEKIKKFRNKFDQSMTCFEDLSNELLCVIFDYFYGHELCKIFSNLNFRFEQLLHSSFVLFKTRCYLFENDEVMNMFKQLMFPHRHQIFSMNVNFIFQNNYFFSSFLFDSSFDRLESIFLKDIQSDTLIPVLSNLSSLPHLFSLTIETSNVKEKINDIYRLTFVLPQLKYYRLSFSDKPHSIILPIAMNNQFSPLEYLVIDHYCSLNELVILISYTTQLRHLTLHKTQTNDLNSTILSSIILDNLESICLNLRKTKFNELETFITKIIPNLKTLSIIESDDIAFLDAYRWEQLILNYFPKLENFYLLYNDQVNNKEEYPTYIRGMNQFSSSFWIERQWLFEVEVTDIYNEYTIRPYSERWYDDIKHDIVNCSVEHSTFTNLTIEYIPNYIFEGVMFKAIERVLTITRIYHLEIHQRKISIPVLIQIINLLPDIITLKIYSLSTDETEELNVKELLILCSMKETSKISKVYLEEIADIQQLDFIFTLCPYMEYFKVNRINIMDAQSFLCTILKKINRNNYHSLRSLCFDVPTTYDQIVKNIEEIITCEKLLFHTKVQCILNTVYLQWK